MSANATRGKKSLLSVIFLQPEEDSDRLRFTPCNCVHDFVLGHLAGKLGYLLMVAHYHDAVARAQYFLKLRGNKHAGFAFLC